MGSTNSPLLERRGSQQPTWLEVPSDAFDNGSGDDAIELAALAGLELDDWQQDIMRASLLVRESNPSKWAASTVHLVVGRQNGKGSLLEARQLAGLVLFKSDLAIHTAQALTTTAEHFLRMQHLIEGCPDIERKVMRIRTGKGDESIEMRSGARLRFLARGEKSGRGFAGVDDLYLDESMFLADGMMRSVFSTMAAKSKKGNPSTWVAGSAPYAGRPEQEWALKQLGILRSERRPPSTLYVDFGIVPPTAEELDEIGSLEAWIERAVNDRDNWYATNPALGERISEEFCEEELTKYGPLGFAVERLSLAIPPEDAENRSGIELADFDSAVDEFDLNSGATIGVAVDERGARGALVAAGLVDGRTCVEVVASGGIAELVEWIRRQAVGAIGKLAFAGSSNGSMVVTLLGAECPLTERFSQQQVCTAEALFVDLVSSAAVVHRGDSRLRAAILGAEQSASGSSQWSWLLRKASADITPLKAAAIAAASCRTDADAFDPNEVFVH